MARIAILDRINMNAEQARVYDAAKQSSGIVGGPYYAYIRLRNCSRLAKTCGLLCRSGH
jgi:hypothetical protein